MKLDTLKTYKKIGILGYAREGEITMEYLKKYHPDAEIGILDQKFDEKYLEKQHEYDLIIKTPVIRPDVVTVPYTTATNIFMANSKHIKIGITGTKGKSTAVSLLYHVLKHAGKKVALYGNIGTPMLKALVDGVPDDTTIILELSNYQLEDISYSPHIACILNIHRELHNHPTFESYAGSKINITRYQSHDDFLFYNGAFPEIKSKIKLSKAKKIDISKIEIPQLEYDALSFRTHPDTLKAVYGIFSHFGYDNSIFSEALKTFTSLPYRLHSVGIFNAITWYEDSASTHPSATITALNLINKVHTVLLGGQYRGYDFSELAHELSKKKISEVLLFPETEDEIEKAIRDVAGYSPTITRCNTMKQAVEYAFSHTPEQSAVLLSPGAPSYSMYKNFTERGDDYVQCIHSHAKK